MVRTSAVTTTTVDRDRGRGRGGAVSPMKRRRHFGEWFEGEYAVVLMMMMGVVVVVVTLPHSPTSALGTGSPARGATSMSTRLRRIRGRSDDGSRTLQHTGQSVQL